MTIAFYCVPVLGEPEHGVSVKVPASWRGVAGHYSLGMGIDQEAAVHISAETNGQPKFLCDITYFRLGDAVTARATHQGYTFVEFSGRSTGSVTPRKGEFTEHEWWTKYSRAIGGAPGTYDFAPHVVDVCTTFEPRHLEAVETLNHEIVRDSLGPVLGPVLKMATLLAGASPATLFSRLDQLASAGSRGSTHTWAKESDTSGTLTIRYPSPQPLALMEAIWRGIFRVTRDLLGTPVIIDSVTEAPGHAFVFRIRW